MSVEELTAAIDGFVEDADAERARYLQEQQTILVDGELTGPQRVAALWDAWDGHQAAIDELRAQADQAIWEARAAATRAAFGPPIPEDATPAERETFLMSFRRATEDATRAVRISKEALWDVLERAHQFGDATLRNAAAMTIVQQGRKGADLRRLWARMDPERAALADDLDAITSAYPNSIETPTLVLAFRAADPPVEARPA